MPPQKSKGRTGLRSLEDNALLLLIFAISLAFAWILWPFFGALLWAAVLAIVFTPLHEWLLRAMPKRQNLPALATVLIILTLVILPLTLIAASLVQEAANFHENMQGGSWNPGAFFQQFLALLPSWATDLLDRLGLKDLAAVQAKLSAKAACSLPRRRSISGSAPSTSSSASPSCCTCWAVVMALCSLLPAVGAAIVWFPVAVYFLATGSVWQGVVLAYGVFVMGLVDNLLRPLLIGKGNQMPDYLVLISTLGGIAAFGLSGFVIGPVVAALFIAVWDIFSRSRQSAHDEGKE
jgi:predicted PurR-regulated permease PerM